MTPSNIISALALTLACASFGYTVIATKGARISASKPVVVFEYSGSNGWSIKNVGNGPALDVVVSIRASNGAWENPVRVPPLGADSSIKLMYLAHTNVESLGARYADTNKRVYSSIVEKDQTQILEGNHFPEWSEAQVVALWAAEPL